MRIINKESFMSRIIEMENEIKAGKIFIYPTDTIYGIGCDARNPESVKKIREIKKRSRKPFSIIANQKWIISNCKVDEKEMKWINKLPGPYTLILNLNKNNDIAKEVPNGDTIGVRIPDNWFGGIITSLNVPFVSTSVNQAEEKPMTSLGDIDENIKNSVDYIIDGGMLDNNPSTIVDLTKAKEKIIR